MTSAWIMWMFGLQVCGWIALGTGKDLNHWIDFSIALSFAVGGFFLGCYFPNFMIIIGTSAVGSMLFVVGIGIMAEQYPGEAKGQAKYIWWLYLTGQVILGVAGFFFQFCWGYKKNGHSVIEDNKHMLYRNREVELEAGGNVEIEVDMNPNSDSANVQIEVEVDI